MITEDTWLCNQTECKYKMRSGFCQVLREIEVDRKGRMIGRCSFFKPRLPEDGFEVIDGVRVIRDSHSIIYIEEVKK